MKRILSQITNKNNLQVIIFSLFCILIITILLYHQTHIITQSSSNEKAQSALSFQANLIESNIQKTQMLTGQLKNIVESKIPYSKIKENPALIEKYKQSLKPLILSTVKSFNAKTGWIVFDTNLIQNAGIISYYYDGENYIAEKEYDVHKDNYSKEPWWTDTFKNGYTWTLPYYWEPWKTDIISFSQVAYSNSIPIAAVGSELYYKDIEKNLASAQLFENAPILLLNENKIILFDATTQNIGKSYSEIYPEAYSFIKKNEVSKTSAVIDTSTKSQHSLLAYHKLSNDWILVSNPNTSSFFKQIDQQSLHIILTISAFLLVVITIYVVKFYFK